MNPSTPPRPRKHLRVGHLIIALIILAGLIGAAVPWIQKQRQASIQTEALNNLRQIGMSLFAFDSEYGTFPDNDTAADVQEETGTSLKLSGSYSNDYFRQLIAEGLASEQPFWCKTPFSPKKPDNIIDPPSRALEAGEVGFSYIMFNRSRGQSSSGDPGRAIVVAPSYKARGDWTFDPGIFEGKALILKIDNSASAMRIDPATGFITTGVKDRYVQTIGARSPWGYDPALLAPLPAGNAE